MSHGEGGSEKCQPEKCHVLFKWPPSKITPMSNKGKTKFQNIQPSTHW